MHDGDHLQHPKEFRVYNEQVEKNCLVSFLPICTVTMRLYPRGKRLYTGGSWKNSARMDGERKAFMLIRGVMLIEVDDYDPSLAKQNKYRELGYLCRVVE